MLKRFSVNYILFSIFTDATCVIAAFLIGLYLRSTLPYGRVPLHPDGIPRPIFYLIAVSLWVLVAFTTSLYDPRSSYKAVNEFQTLVLTWGFFSLAVAGVLYFTFRDVSRLLVAYALVVLLLLVALWRTIARVAFRVIKSPPTERRVLIVGAGSVGQQVAEMVEAHRWTGLKLVGYLDDDLSKRQQGLPVLGMLNDARAVVEERKVDEVVIALPRRANERLNQLVAVLHELPVHTRVVPDYFALALYRAVAENFAGIPMIDLRAPALNDYQRLVKRLFDLTLGSVITILAMPVMAVVAVAIKLDSPGPVLFRQQRVGENGRLFTMYKFRSMVVGAEKMQAQVNELDEEGHIIHKKIDDPRVTRVGRFIRRTSLDELPQLFNVLKGDMSLVGPRPELPWLVEEYDLWQRKRFAVPQGITGWWQVNGRSDKPMHLHTEDDLYYVQNYSLWLDLLILLKTVFVVLKGQGAY
ncbi:MAG TPA: undecaprenyl-phosphate glucose phosphotransferase [Anaerolineae bacterium]|nr:undecaprenyl-phosphate glucose phosphotransferase [Anaerolineae bacterium]